MDAEKKAIRRACKEAYSYQAWRNPVGTWFVTLYDKDGNGTVEWEFTEFFSSREKAWAWKQLEGIDQRRKQNETSN